jgi:Fic family protein
MQIGSIRNKKTGYKAFILDAFPPKSGFDFQPKIIQKASHATLLLGKLDGITQLLPDLDFFIFMYIRKDAASSSQIEGTQATMIDAIEAESRITDDMPDDVDDILHYIDALKFGLERLKSFPMSLRLIKQIHKELMKDARSSHFADPGSFRKTQNWIGGTSPSNASFVPPPPQEMNDALGDYEKFLHAKDDLLPIIKAGIIHSHFETIHPFLDGNGRAGRILITLYLWINQLIDQPVLFLSSYFKKHQKIYYERLNGYHDGDIGGWIDFFLDGVSEVAKDAIETVKQITILREEDLKKINSLGKTAAKSSIGVIHELYKLPIVNVNTIQKWTGFSRAGAQKTIERFVELDILEQKHQTKTYRRSFIYKRYVDIFNDK